MTMDIVNLKKSILEDNDQDANALRKELDEKGIYYINVMSAPGSGKTTLLTALIKALRGRCKIGVMESDIDGDVDAYTVRSAGCEAIQLHTDGMCHLDADMSRQGFKAFGTSAQMVFLENIGNLVCPAEFDCGAHLKMALLAMPEGDDKPLKYTLMFSTCDIVVITKCDTAKYFDFDVEKCRKYIAKINPKAEVFEVCAKSGDGVDMLADALYERYKSHSEVAR